MDLGLLPGSHLGAGSLGASWGAGKHRSCDQARQREAGESRHSAPGREVKFTFAAKANTNVTFNVTHFNFHDSQGAVQVTLYFYEPGSSSAYTQCNFSSNGICTVKTPVGGTWSIALVPTRPLSAA
jgi:hypothetical protein